MKKVKTSVTSVASSVARFTFKIGSLAGALTGIAGVAGFTALIKRSLETNDALAKTSDKLGIATEKLAAMRLAAKLTGVENATLEKGLQNMVRNVSDAAQGIGEAKDALQDLGVDAARLNKLSPDEMFRDIAEGMSRIPNQADRVRIAYDIFGGRATALLNTLNLGAKGLDDIQKKTERYGTAISRIDAAKIERANDAWTLLRESFSGIITQISVQLAPFLEFIANQLDNIGNTGETMAAKINRVFEQLITGAISFGVALREEVLNVLPKIEQAFLNVAKYVAPTAILRKAMEDRLDEIDRMFDERAAQSDRLLDDFRRKIEAIRNKIIGGRDFTKFPASVPIPGLGGAAGRGGVTGSIGGSDVLLRAGQRLGRQKFGDDSKNLKDIKDNTSDAAESLTELVQLMRGTGFPVVGFN